MAKWIRLKDATTEQLNKFSNSGYFKAVERALNRDLALVIVDSDNSRAIYNKLKHCGVGVTKLSGFIDENSCHIFMIFSLKLNTGIDKIVDTLQKNLNADFYMFDKKLSDYTKNIYMHEFNLDRLSLDLSNFVRKKVTIKSIEPIFFISLDTRFEANIRKGVERNKASIDLNIQGFDFSTYIC